MKSRTAITALLLCIVILGSIAAYENLLLQTMQTNTKGQIYANPAPVQALDSSRIYSMIDPSVVTVSGVEYGGSALGAGFVLYYNNAYYIVTNFHVVDGMNNITVTFANGDAYRAKVVGSDQLSDLAVVSVKAPASEFHRLQLGNSSALTVGEPVVAIGNPYGLSGTITIGVISQVGRTLTETDSLGISSFDIPGTIQFSAPINPGNSGGPLVAPDGSVVGITAAVVDGSQGLGFAIPSDTIQRELPLLVKTGSYDQHPYLGADYADMTLDLAQLTGTSTTWGVLVQDIVHGGPAGNAGLRGGTEQVFIADQGYMIGGDIIVSIDGTKIVNYDALRTYMEAHDLPGQTIQVGIIRQGATMTIPVQVGSIPSTTT